MLPAVPTMDDVARRLYYLRLRGEALGIASDATEIAELCRLLAERPRTALEDLPLDLRAWFPGRRNTIEHMRSEVLLMAGAHRGGVRDALRRLVRRRGPESSS